LGILRDYAMRMNILFDYTCVQYTIVQAVNHNMTYGIIYLMVTQVASVASSYSIHIGFAHLLRNLEYGTCAIIISLIRMINSILMLIGHAIIGMVKGLVMKINLLGNLLLEDIV